MEPPPDTVAIRPPTPEERLIHNSVLAESGSWFHGWVFVGPGDDVVVTDMGIENAGTDADPYAQIPRSS